MPLLVVSYPALPQQHLDWILSIRHTHPELQHSLLPPHFTLVFPTSHLTQPELLAHVQEHAAHTHSFPFTLRCSLLVKEDNTDLYYLFLVPDVGFSRLVRLHDALYTGLLAPALRLDIPYIPHITIGYHSDSLLCKRLVGDLNRQQFELHGMIESLDVVSKDGDEVRAVERLQLA